MACTTLDSGRLLGCKDSVGGIKAVSFAVWSGKTTGDTVTAVDGEVAALPTGLTAVYRYELKADGNTFVDEVTADAQTRSTFYTGTLTLVLQKLNLETRNQIKMLSAGELNVFIEEYNGDVLVMGAGFGAQVTDGSLVTGGARTDLNGANLILTSQELEPVLFLSEAAKAQYNGIVVNGV